MANEYYTPIIEEFHVGFEYEHKQGFLNGAVKTKRDYDKSYWVHSTAGIGDFPYIERALTGINSQNGICGIRVKALDKEDIWFLAWKPAHITYLHGESNEWTYYGKWFLKFIDGEVIIHNGRDMEDNVTYFDGVIKNKSELLRVMNMLEIN